MISVQEAQQKITEQVERLPSELVDIEKANGRVLAEELQSDRDLPPFNRSTFDGIALSYSAVSRGQREFRITGIGYAGSPKTALADEEACVEIMTGAPVPDQASCVVKVEDIQISNGIAILNDGIEISKGFGVHPAGSDCRIRETLLEPGCRLSAKELSIAASIGKAQLLVSRRPRISIITTGDELVEISATPLPHQIRRSNDLALQLALESAGYPDLSRHHLLDDPQQTESVVSTLIQTSDVLILAGGVSKGKKDFLPDALEKAGVKKAFQWVRQRPGKPMWFGTCESDGKKTLVFALPGNPVSCFTCLHRYALPALAIQSGQSPEPPQFAKLREPFTFAPQLTLFLPVSANCDETGQLWAEPLPFNTSGDYISVARTQGFIELPHSESNFEKGSSYPFIPWSR